MSFDGVTIWIPPILEEPNVIRLELGYPSSELYTGEDPRSNPVVIEALEQAFDSLWDEFAGEMLPTTFQIDETVIGEDAPLQIASFTSEAETVLRQAREYVGYFRLAYILSIVISTLLIAGIVLIYRNVKGSTRTLGIVFLASGLVMLALALIGKNVGGEQMLQAMLGEPPQLQVWASQLLVDFLAPLQWLGIGFMAGGIALLVVSFVCMPSPTTD